MTISGGRTKQLNIFCRLTGFTSDFLSFIVVELIRFFHGPIQLFDLIALVAASVVKQYNLVPANGQWCLAAWKVTLGLASHWPRVTDICCSPHKGLGLEEGDEHPPTLSCGAWSTLLLPVVTTSSIILSTITPANRGSPGEVYVKMERDSCTACVDRWILLTSPTITGWRASRRRRNRLSARKPTSSVSWRIRWVCENEHQHHYFI